MSTVFYPIVSGIDDSMPGCCADEAEARANACRSGLGDEHERAQAEPRHVACREGPLPVRGPGRP